MDKILYNVKLTKTATILEFELMSYRFVVKPLTHCATPLGDNNGKETTYTL